MTRTPETRAALPAAARGSALPDADPAGALPPRSGAPATSSGASSAPQLPEGAPDLNRETVDASSQFSLEDLPPRIASRILVNPVTGCWEWQGFCDPGGGYGRIAWQSRKYVVHRLVYTLLAGPIPDGLQLDHVKARGCVSRSCCWPGHLEPVTNAENQRRGNGVSGIASRKTHCPQGHPYNEQNTIRTSKGHRTCRICRRRKDVRKGNMSGNAFIVRLPSEIVDAAVGFSVEQNVDLSTWVASLIRAEVQRRTGEVMVA